MYNQRKPRVSLNKNPLKEFIRISIIKLKPSKNISIMARKSKTTEAAPVAVAPTPAPAASSGGKRRSKAAAAAAPSTEVVEKRPVSYPSLSEDGRSLSYETVDLTDMEQLVTAVKRTGAFLRVLATMFSRTSEAVQTLYNKSVREANRKRHKRPVDLSKPAKHNTFTYRYVVRPEANEFLGNSKGAYVTRVELSSAVTRFIKEHNLKGEDGVIKRHKTLNLVLNTHVDGDNGEKIKNVTYKNLQKFLNWNYKEKAPENAQDDPEVAREESRRKKAERSAGKGSSRSATTAVEDEVEDEEEAPAKKPSRKPKSGKKRSTAGAADDE